MARRAAGGDPWYDKLAVELAGLEDPAQIAAVLKDRAAFKHPKRPRGAPTARRPEGHIEPVVGVDGKQRSKGGLLVWRIEAPLPARPGEKRRRVRRTVYGTRDQAKTELRDLLASRDKGRVSIDRVTVAELAERWKEAQSARWKPSTAARHKTNLVHYLIPALGGLPARMVTTDDLNRLYASAARGGSKKRPLSPRSVASIHETARAMFEYGAEVKACVENPVLRARPPKQRKRRREPLPDMVVAEILAAAPGLPQQALLRVLAVTGARPAEACALRWTHLELEGDLPLIRFSRGLSSGVDPVTGVRVSRVEGPTKTDEDERPVVVDPATAEVLRRWRVQRIEQSMQLAGTFNPAGFVFVGRDDRGSGELPLSPLSASQMFRRLLVKLGYGGRWELYDLKRWSSTVAGEDGAHPKAVMARLGHTQLSTTIRYQQARLEVDAQIAQSLGRRLSGD